MTPEEKAKELVEKYKLLVTNWDCYHDTELTDEETLEDRKKCALIAIDEIINLNCVWFDRSASLEEDESDTLEYWQQVKASITNL